MLPLPAFRACWGSAYRFKFIQDIPRDSSILKLNVTGFNDFFHDAGIQLLLMIHAMSADTGRSGQDAIALTIIWSGLLGAISLGVASVSLIC